jgi:hypothetical protein
MHFAVPGIGRLPHLPKDPVDEHEKRCSMDIQRTYHDGGISKRNDLTGYDSSKAVLTVAPGVET